MKKIKLIGCVSLVLGVIVVVPLISTNCAPHNTKQWNKLKIGDDLSGKYIIFDKTKYFMGVAGEPSLWTLITFNNSFEMYYENDAWGFMDPSGSYTDFAYWYWEAGIFEWLLSDSYWQFPDDSVITSISIHINERPSFNEFLTYQLISNTPPTT